MKIVSLVGNRPQFVKEAVVHRAVEGSGLTEIIVHSGQHYDQNMSGVFFESLGIRKPDYDLGVGSGTHGEITGRTMQEFERVVDRERPAAVVVYGDTDTTLAGALVAAKQKVPLAHVEAGIRMLPRSMPEEINRVVTDRIADLLFCPTRAAVEALEREHVPGRIEFVGDTMYDLFLLMAPQFSDACLGTLGVEPGSYAVCTVHRQANVDDRDTLAGILAALGELARDLPMVFPIHPRTRKMVARFGLDGYLDPLLVTEPVGYLEMMGLVSRSRLVITDSGGLQKEAFFAGRRALVLLDDPGWRELVEAGWNVSVTSDSLVATARTLAEATPPSGLYGEGDAGHRIVKTLLEAL